MRPFTLTQTGVGQTQPITLDHKASQFQVGFGVIVSGTVTYNVEHTFDELENTKGVVNGNVTWFPHATVNAQTVSKDGNYAFPIRALRVNVTAGTGSARIIAIQAGYKG